jgi:diaminopimelate decarboxylase/aspartate kinase
MTCTHPWWYSRKDEIMVLGEERSPCLVYNEESINDTLFDLLCIEAFETVLYPVQANPHPGILEKAYDMGTGFRCLSWREAQHVLDLFPDIAPHRMLLFPGTGTAKTWERAFSSGYHVVLKSLDALRAWPDRFRGREILVWVSAGGVNKGDADVREPTEPCFTLSDMDCLLETSEKVKAAVVGLYAWPNKLCWIRTGAEEFFSYFEGIWSRLEKASIFVLAGAPQKPDFGGIDMAATVRIAEALQWRHPDAKFWLDPGFLVVSEAGALLIKAQTIVQQKEGFCIGTDAGKEIIIAYGGKGPHHEVVNLSGLDRGVGEHGDEIVMGVSRHISSFESGDILLITNMGAAAMYSAGNTGLREAVSEHYLRARSICQVEWRLPGS